MNAVALRIAVCLWSVGGLVACGGDDAGGGDGPGTVAAPWLDYCTATFTEDTPIIDVFDEELFTARAGESYLLSDHGPGFDSGEEAEMIFLAAGGPATFTVGGDEGSLPLTSDCFTGTPTSHYGAFTDVTVYADETLATELCSLDAGATVTAAGGGYSIAGQLSFSGPQTYEVYLGGFGEQCGDAAVGYVSVPETMVFGSTTWLVPLQPILAQ